METSIRLPQRYAVIIDPYAIREMLEKLNRLDLPRRQCHPLDRYTGRKAALEQASFDAQVEAEGDMSKDELDEICDAMDAVCAADGSEADEDGQDLGDEPALDAALEAEFESSDDRDF